MVTYNITKYTYEECLKILHTYTQIMRHTTCPDVRNDYAQARATLISYMDQKWRKSLSH
jgi:hypothetical protein